MPHTTPQTVLLLCLVVMLAVPVESGLAQQSAAPAPPATETPAVVAEGTAAQTLLGKPVLSANGEDLGRVVDVIVSRSGSVQAAIIDFGGFLGVGTRKIAVDWHVLHFSDGEPLAKLIANLPREELRKAPVYKEGEPVVIIGRTAPASASPTSPPRVAKSPSDAPAQPPQTDQPSQKP